MLLECMRADSAALSRSTRNTVKNDLELGEVTKFTIRVKMVKEK